jgi:hypothetical protein
MRTFTDDSIQQEIAQLPLYEREAVTSLDMVRLSIAWLSAQTRIKRPNKLPIAQKHMIERWAGRYIPAPAVMVAARLLGIKGPYPYLAISSKFTKPHPRRCEGILEAGLHPNYSEQAFMDNPNYFREEA